MYAKALKGRRSKMYLGFSWYQEEMRSLAGEAKKAEKDGKPKPPGWTTQKLKQALDNFNTIVSGFSATDSVDDALLEIGRYQMDVEKNVEKAREAFEQVTKRYPQSDGAPGAYYYLGMVTLARAAAAADVEDALAQFGRVQRLYPGSEWVPRALYASATAQRKAGRFPEALEAGRRVFLEHPSSEAAPAAPPQAASKLRKAATTHGLRNRATNPARAMTASLLASRSTPSAFQTPCG